MTSVTQAIRSGDWLTAIRVRNFAVIVLVTGVAMLVGLVATRQGLSDFQGRPLGTDFSNVYAAGNWVLAGRPEAAFDPALQHQMEKRIFGPSTPFYGWHYPPIFLGVAALLASLTYLSALVVWQAISFAAYLVTMRAIVPRPEIWLPAIAYPAVVINMAHGHNGFLSAALFGGGLVLLERRPVYAGVLIGLLCYKPQFGILIPFALVAGGHVRAFAAATATVVAAVTCSWLMFGTGAWMAFSDSLEFTRTVVLEQGGAGFHKIQSVFAAFRLWGAPVKIAYAAQAATMAIVAAALIVLWRSAAAFSLKAAALLAGATLATPYVLDYDLMLMAPALAFFVAHALERGFHTYERTLLGLCWLAPLFTRTLGEFTNVPIGLFALLLLFGLTFRRAATDKQMRVHSLSVLKTSVPN
jgi:alpha-1,2-mannosyltransferase